MTQHWTRYAGLLTVLAVITACNGQIETISVPETPSPTMTGTASPAPKTQIEVTNTPSATARPTATPTLTPTQPTIASPEALLEALVWEGVEGVAGYPLKALTGWEMGFRSDGYCLTGPYRWLDGEHLLLLPIIGRLPFQGEAVAEVTQPFVVNLSGAEHWIVGEQQEYCWLPVWSQAADRVIEVVEGEVRLRDLEGRVTARYPGKLPLELAPSGLRLMAGDTWIDIETGEVIPLPGWGSGGAWKIGWTEDEQRIFGCCFSYADVRGGDRWERAEFPGFYRVGRGSWPGEEVWATSHWIRNDTQVIVDTLATWFLRQPDNQTGIPISVIPLFDPAGRGYVDLISELDLGTPPNCGFHLGPQADRLWLNCWEQSGNRLYSYEEVYLVTLSSLEVVVASGQPEFLGWSRDGRYLVYNRTAESDEGGQVSMLMTSGGESRQLADPAAERVSWHPSEPFGGLYLGDGRELLFFDALSGKTRQLDFGGTILDAVWEPGGMGIILLSEEGRLLWLEDVFDAGRSPEPITPPLSGIHSLRWSPDGGRLAFVSENILYVVTLNEDQ